LRQREIEIVTSTSNSNFCSTEMEHQNTTASLSQTQENPGPINDISLFCNRVLSHAEKVTVTVLNNIWSPDVSYSFPVIKSGRKEKKLKFQYSWLSRWNWLAYSEVENGAYCKFCIVFSKAGAGINSQSLGALSKKKFDNWKKAIDTFEKHSHAQYHLQSLADADYFLNVDKNNLLSVENKLSADRTQKILENRQKIVPIIDVVILCGVQEMALRGYRDSGKSSIITAPTDKNQGNFRAILRYRAKGDDLLKNALEGPGERNKYTSPTIQNEIIDSCNALILERVVSEVNAAKCFSVLADETADISGVEQVSLCMRYVDLTTLKIKEHFLQFVPTADVTGEGLAKVVLNNLREFDIDNSYLDHKSRK
jgi:ribosomal protein L20